MKNALKASCLLSLLAVCVAPAAGPRTPGSDASSPGPAGAPAPKIAAGDFETQAASPNLAKAIRSLASDRSGPFWLGYAVPAVDRPGTICCFDSVSSMKPGRCGRCRLEEDTGFSINTSGDEKVNLEASEYLYVLVRLAKGDVDKIRVFSQECELEVGKRSFVWLTGVSEVESLEWLAASVEGGNEDRREEAITAIALHRDAAADRLLERFISRTQPQEVREHAAFWMGQARGRAGLEPLRRLAVSDPSEEMRGKAIFALSQSDLPEALGIMIESAHKDPSGDVRGEALFWLAQKAGQKAMEAITGAMENDPDTDVKKKAVFALTQLPTEEGTTLLIDVARKNKNREVRKEAIFWLGQSEDPRALAFIEGILGS